MFFIESERLRLIPLTHQLLQLYASSRAAMELAVGLNISTMQVDPFYQNEIEDAITNFWLPKTLEHPGAYLWYTDWEIILKSGNISIGGIGFAGEPPDSYRNEQGEAEIGYMIDGQHHNKGYATEALKLMTGWAFSHAAVKAVIVHTYEDNLPSRRILIKNGFTETSKNEDNLMTYKLMRA